MKHIYLILALLVVSSFLSAVTALHEPPMFYISGESLTLRVDIMDGLADITKVNLSYKPVEAENYSRRQMQPQEPGSSFFFIDLDSKDLADLDFQYYFEFEMGTDQVQRFPEELEGGVPFSLKVEYQPGREEEGFVLLSTDEDFALDDGYILAVSYIAIADTLRPESIEVWVRGKNVTKKSVITGNTLVYRDKSPKAGSCRAIITAETKGGEKIKSASFVTDIKRAKSKPRLDLNGIVGLAVNSYDHSEASGADPSGYQYPQDEQSAWLDFYSRLGKVKLNANVLYSSREDDNSQPVNRYRLGLDFPLLGIYAGDNSPHLSPLVMSNKNVRGLYGRLSGKYIGLEVTVGDMVRKTEASPTEENSITAFRQEAIGGRLRLGSERGLSMSFNMSRNRDIISSLDESLYISIDPVTADTLFSVAPQDNLVASLDTRINIPGLRTLFGAEVAGSLLNRNTWPGPISSEEIGQYVDGLDFIDPTELASIFVINKNMEPLLPGLSNLAANVYFRSLILNHLINVNASVTGPVFNSLSTWQNNQDTQQLSITDMFNLGRFLFLSGGYTQVKDNFSKTAQETNESTTWFVQSSLRLFKVFNLKLGYYDSETQNVDNPELADGHVFTPYLRNSYSLNVSLGYLSPNTYIFPYQLELLYRTGVDHNQVSTPLTDVYSNDNNSLNLSLTTKLKQIPLRLQAVLSLAHQNNNFVSVPTDPSTLDNLNIYAKASYSLLRDKLKPYLSIRQVNLTGEQDQQKYQYLAGGLEAYPLKNMSISTELSKSNYTNDTQSTLDRDSLTWNLTLSQRF